MPKDKKCCIGCNDNFYNGNNPYGIKECWYFKDAKIVTRYRIGVNAPMNRKENFTKVKVLNCYKQNGLFYCHGLPDHLK